MSHAEILQMQVESRNREELEKRIFKEYNFNVSTKMMEKDLINWVKSHGKRSITN